MNETTYKADDGSIHTAALVGEALHLTTANGRTIKLNLNQLDRLTTDTPPAVFATTVTDQAFTILSLTSRYTQEADEPDLSALPTPADLFHAQELASILNNLEVK